MKVFESTLYPPHLPAFYRKLVPLVQINLNDEPLEKNIKFMKLLFWADITEPVKRFDKLDCSKFDWQEKDPEKFRDMIDKASRRQRDTEVNLEKFISSIKEPWHIVLQVGSPDTKSIVFCISFDDTEKIDRFAWFECPYNDRNLEEVRRLFREVYGQEI